MTVVTWTLRLLDWFGKYLPNTSLPALSAPTIPQSPSMVLAEMVGLELLKLDFKEEKGARKRTDKTVGSYAKDSWEEYITHPKFSITFYHTRYYYDNPRYHGNHDQETLWRTVIKAGDYTFNSKGEEEKIIIAGLKKARKMIEEREQAKKAHAREMEAVDAIAAWCRTDPKLLEE